jgi:hypothetical protein
MSNLVDELTQKQAPKFQLNLLNLSKSIKKTITENDEGIFYLSSGLSERAQKITEEMKKNYSNYNFQLNKLPTNYEIMFKRIGDKK